MPPSRAGKQDVKVGRVEKKGSAIERYGLNLPHDHEVSSLHGFIFRERGKYYWMDDDSTNGTVVVYDDGEHVEVPPHEHYLLQDGITLKLGKCVLKINFSS